MPASGSSLAVESVWPAARVRDAHLLASISQAMPIPISTSGRGFPPFADRQLSAQFSCRAIASIIDDLIGQLSGVIRPRNSPTMPASRARFDQFLLQAASPGMAWSLFVAGRGLFTRPGPLRNFLAEPAAKLAAAIDQRSRLSTAVSQPCGNGCVAAARLSSTSTSVRRTVSCNIFRRRLATTLSALTYASLIKHGFLGRRRHVGRPLRERLYPAPIVSRPIP